MKIVASFPRGLPARCLKKLAAGRRHSHAASGLDLNDDEVREVYALWNKGELNVHLVETTGRIFSRPGANLWRDTILKYEFI
jgi:hypothetical protein